MEFMQYVVSGLAVGSVYGLVALGFVLVFKATDVFNFAQGDFVMVGAYLGFGAMEVFGVPFWIAALVAIVGGMILGLGVYQVLLKPMMGSSLLTMVMVTIALSLAIRAVVVIVWGTEEHSYPSTLPYETFVVGGVRISSVDLSIMGISLLAVLVFGIFFRFTGAGLQMRAVGEYPEASAVVGINVPRVFAIALMVASVTAAIGGVLLANLQVVSPHMAAIGLLAFPAAVLGGLVIWVVNQLGVGYFGGQAATAVTFSVLLLVLMVRPNGLLGSAAVVRA